MTDFNSPTSTESESMSSTSTELPVLRREARVMRTDRSLAAMVLAICTLGGSGIGFGFAMYLVRAQLAYGSHMTPSALVQPIGHVTWLGVLIRSIDDRPGSLVLRVYDHTGAALAGVHPGDLITTFDGVEISDIIDLETAVRARTAGDIVSLGIERDGRPLVLAARLDQR